MAASLLIALAMGIGIGQFWQDKPPALVADPGKSAQPPGEPSGGSLIAKTDRSDTTPIIVLRPENATPRDAGSDESFRVPIYLASHVSEDYLQDTPPPLSVRLQQALERSGHKAELRRQWIPLQFEDGSQIVFPVDQVQLHYVGNPSHQ